MEENRIAEGRRPCQSAGNWFSVYGDIDDFIFYETEQEEPEEEYRGSRR